MIILSIRFGNPYSEAACEAEAGSAGEQVCRDQPACCRDERALRKKEQRLYFDLEFPCYGRRITAELKRNSRKVNHKHVHRIMREDNLLCLRRRRFIVTTDSKHPRPIYPNIAAELEVTAINQLWVADITYIRLETKFVYLAMILDAFSRRVVGWAWDRTSEANLVLAALAERWKSGGPSPAGCIIPAAACSMPAAITPAC